MGPEVPGILNGWFTKMNTRKQHFVPQFYLKGFAFGDTAWAARKDANGIFEKPFIASVSDLCSKRDYHEVKVSHAGGPGDLAIRNRIESLLSRLEHDLAGPLRDMRSARELTALGVVMVRHLASMKILLAHMIMRNPMILDPARKESERVAKLLFDKGMISREELPFFDRLGLTPKELTEHSILNAELLSMAEGSSMQSILSWLDGAGVLVLRAKVGGQFITADIPFVMSWDDSKSELPAYIFFPLDWRTAVIFHTYDNELATRYADVEEVAFWNNLLIRWCIDTRTVISKSERALLLATGEHSDYLQARR